MNVIDRRLNPTGKSLPNRQRLLRRLKAQVREAVARSISGRKIADISADTEVQVPVDGIGEPFFRKGAGGDRDIVLPGNKKYVKGDRIAKPTKGDGDGGGQASDSGEGEDAFTFTLSRDEFLDVFFEDLELPDMVKRQLKQSTASVPARAGFSVSGSPQSVDVTRTMRRGMARRLAMRRPTVKDLDELKKRLAEAEAAGDSDSVAKLTEELTQLRRRVGAIPWIDPVDVRYRRFEQRPQPIAQAVMFCLMDVSGSMNEHMKDLAKRFFMLLYLFLQRRYEAVEVVFIRHTHEAREVDEETFFGSPETGGTLVSSALSMAADVTAARFPVDSWNIYFAQASDGDNMSTDRHRVAETMTNALLPACQYFAYLEVGDPHSDSWDGSESASELWRTYQKLTGPGVPLAMRRATTAAEIFEVFRDLFARDAVG
ncbi:YeaH/YhbH family protein [Telmatospirillum sp.]|uniref:YeaH/YhbH family protein n=1 Tax=Telmatospirillum sp. TaxID=2079197 RepID=UPI002842D318|nr:YeaH/YhbH family protein [Telmatospirillum sp.]MDR3437931.1 YeaH/YhbH family protein [Telmatospirillum sp.]